MIARARVLATLGATLWGGSRTTRALAQSPLTVTVGSGITESNAQLFYAIDRGFLARNGVTAKVTMLRSGGPIMESVVAGQLETGSGNSVSLGSAILRGIPFLVIAPAQLWVANSPSGAVVVAPDSPISSFKDLAGMTVGTISLRNVGELAFDTYLAQAGVPLDSVKFVELAPMETAAAVATGRVAAATMLDPELAVAIARGQVRRLAPAYDGIAKAFYLTLWFARRDWVERNVELTKRFTDAIVEGGVWSESNSEQAAAILEKWTKVQDARAEARWGHSLDPAFVQAIWDQSYRFKIYSRPLRAADYCWNGK